MSYQHQLTKEQAIAMIEELNAGMVKHNELQEYRDLATRAEHHLEALITVQARQTEAIHRLKSELAQQTIESQFYKFMLQTVKENEVLQPIWDELMTTMKLLDPEVEAKFQSIIVNSRFE